WSMNMSTRFGFNHLHSLLGRSEVDLAVENFFGGEMSNIHRDDYYGSLEFKPEGVEVVFKEAPWVLPSERITNPTLLRIAAFHFHREGHDGYAGYLGQLANGVAFGDSETELLRKMGEPIKRGGGGMGSLLGPIPQWFWFTVGAAIFHVPLSPSGQIDMATLQI